MNVHNLTTKQNIFTICYEDYLYILYVDVISAFRCILVVDNMYRSCT